MKKIALLAIAALLSASLSTADAAKKKTKNKQSETATVSDCCVQQPVVLTTADDSLSYAAGMTSTQGLIPYLQQQMHVDTAYMTDFLKGYQEAIAKQGDPQFAAYVAGTQIAQMSTQRILPGMKENFVGSEVKFNDELFHRGFAAAILKDNSIYTDSAAQTYFERKSTAVKETLSAAYKSENEEWLEENKKKDGVVTLPSGLQYKVLTAGNGEKPLKEQTVEVKYEGKMIDGTVFDSSYKRNPQTSKFRCDQVIKGWTEALQLMPVGSKWELYIPQNLAYGERQAGQIKPFSTLIFTVELVGIEGSEAPAKPAEKPVGNTAAKNVSKKK